MKLRTAASAQIPDARGSLWLLPRRKSVGEASKLRNAARIGWVLMALIHPVCGVYGVTEPRYQPLGTGIAFLPSPPPMPFASFRKCGYDARSITINRYAAGASGSAVLIMILAQEHR
jgi:hypothetical protein